MIDLQKKLAAVNTGMHENLFRDNALVMYDTYSSLQFIFEFFFYISIYIFESH